MGTCLIKTLSLVPALLLALPAGWCCPVAGSQAEAAPARTAAGCQSCGGQSLGHESGSRPMPERPDGECCCEIGGVVAVHADSQRLELPSATFTDAPLLSSTRSPLSETASAHRFSGRSFQVLHCVWLC